MNYKEQLMSDFVLLNGCDCCAHKIYCALLSGRCRRYERAEFQRERKNGGTKDAVV